MIEVLSWYETPTTCFSGSPVIEDTHENGSQYSSTRATHNDLQVFVGRYGYASADERRKARHSRKRRSGRQSPTGTTKLKHKYRMYNSKGQDYEDDRERVVSFNVEPTIIVPAGARNASPLREKLQVMVQSDDGDVTSLEIDEFSAKELTSSLRSSSNSDTTASATLDVAERSRALNDVWVDPPEAESQKEEDKHSANKEDAGDGGFKLSRKNRRKYGYEKVRPYVRKLSLREQKVLYLIRPELSPDYPKMFEKSSSSSASGKKQPADIHITIVNSLEKQGNSPAPIMKMRVVQRHTV